MPHNLTKRIEIFRSGQHTDTAGRTIDFSDSDIAGSASSYDTSKHEAPLVVGHPAMDDPAFGWVQTLSVENGSLFAEAGQLDANFVEAVEAGRYKKISASFYTPTSPSNPVQGSYYLRHVGFLGGAAPAVKGLSPVQFADDDAGTVTLEFGEEDARDIGSLGRLIGEVGSILQRIREDKIERDGVESADNTIPSWTIEYITDGAARVTGRADERRDDNSPIYSEPNTGDPKMSTQSQLTAADLDRRQAELDQRESELKEQSAAFAEREAQTRRSDNDRLIEGLIVEGKVRAADKPGLLDFMERLDRDDTVSFGEGDAKIDGTAADYFKGFLETLPKAVEFSEVAGSDGDAVEYGDDVEGQVKQIDAKARALVKARADKGEEISFAEAVNIIGKEEKT